MKIINTDDYDGSPCVYVRDLIKAVQRLKKGIAKATILTNYEEVALQALVDEIFGEFDSPKLKVTMDDETFEKIFTPKTTHNADSKNYWKGGGMFVKDTSDNADYQNYCGRRIGNFICDKTWQCGQCNVKSCGCVWAPYPPYKKTYECPRCRKLRESTHNIGYTKQ